VSEEDCPPPAGGGPGAASAWPPTSLPIDASGGVASVAVPSARAGARLVHDALPRIVARVAFPAVASNLLMTLFASVDAFWVGTRLGASGLAAVSTSLFWIWVTVSIAEMVGVGLTAIASRRHGEGRPEEAARLVFESLLYAIALGLGVAVLGTVFLDPLLAVMHTPSDVFVLGRSYLGVFLWAVPLVYGYFAVDAAFRASGDTRTPLAILSVSVAVTLVLDPVLILGLLGAPRLGIAGAAIATGLTRSAAFVIGLSLLFRRRMILPGPIRASSLAAVSRVGLPTALTGVVFSLIYVALTRTTTLFGTPALAALGIGHRVESWLYMICVGFGAAAAAIVGQNLGARRVERAESAGWLTFAYAGVPGVVAGILMLAIPERLASIFTSDPDVLIEAAAYLRICAVAEVFTCAEIVLEGALGGAGETLPPMITSTLLTASRVPLAAWAASRFGVAGIWWTICLTAVGRGLAMMGLWRLGRWKRRAL
jgi:MATE family, multidrug efflux pump